MAQQRHVPQHLVVADGNGDIPTAIKDKPTILSIPISGYISCTTAVGVCNILDGIKKSSTLTNNIKGIILDINSPGGCSSANREIYLTLQQFKNKFSLPIYAYVHGECCSGGFYIACAADEIVSDKRAIIGSVGVWDPTPPFDVSSVLKLLKIKTKYISAGKDKVGRTPFIAWTKEQIAQDQKVVDYLYDIFVEDVLASRHMSREDLTQKYGAQVFGAREAQKYGYIDAINDKYYTLRCLAKKANISDDYQVIKANPEFRG